jgi:hypothetical protein
MFLLRLPSRYSVLWIILVFMSIMVYCGVSCKISGRGVMFKQGEVSEARNHCKLGAKIALQSVAGRLSSAARDPIICGENPWHRPSS